MSGPMAGGHFPGCHPEHERDERQPDKLPEPGEVQDCWHCGTPTPQGCHCSDCIEGGDYIPPDYSCHCPACRRWWATMVPRITTITFGAAGDSAEGGA
jgi:hypothetical protein